jgi:hypothetical protein
MKFSQVRFQHRRTNSVERLNTLETRDHKQENPEEAALASKVNIALSPSVETQRLYENLRARWPESQVRVLLSYSFSLAGLSCLHKIRTKRRVATRFGDRLAR